MAQMHKPKYLKIKTSGSAQRWWCKFRHPMRNGDFVQRSTGILVSDSVAAQKFSDGLAVMLREHFSWDRKAEAEARFPDVAPLYYAVALPEHRRPIDNGIEFNHTLGIAATKDDMERLRKSNTTRGRVLRSDKKKDDEIATLRRDKHAIELEYQKAQLRAGAAEKKLIELEQRILNDHTPITDVSWATAHTEFMTIGKKSGGKGGRPWSHHHHRQTKARLDWWTRQLAVSMISEITLGKIETAFANIQGAQKTRSHYLQTLNTFLNWCCSHNYLKHNPIAKIEKPDTAAEEVWRAPTLEEVRALLAHTPEQRRIIYEVALLSGLRVGELRTLTVGQLDVVNNCLWLGAADAKNRRRASFPLPADLIQRLAALAIGKDSTAPLLKLHGHPSERFNLDAKKAGLILNTPEGKLTFHSLRKGLVTLVQQHAGATLVEAQKLARHSDPRLTANIYSRPAQARQAALVESLGRLLA